jgi:hypothetical protein
MLTILLQVARDVYIYFLAKLSELLDTVSDVTTEQGIRTTEHSK